MTKTPEELTADWKAGKLDWYKFYYCKDGLGRVVIAMKTGESKLYSREMDGVLIPAYWKILAEVPNYEEYAALQEELAEFKRTVTSYIGKPIDYDIACETVNKLLDDKKKLKKELSEHRKNCCCLENEKLWLDKDKLEEEISELLTDNKKMREQIADASKKIEELEDEIAELKKENKQKRIPATVGILQG